MPEREPTDEWLEDAIASAEEAGEVEAGTISFDAMDMVRVLTELRTRRADTDDPVDYIVGALKQWAETEDAAKAVWHAWATGMKKQYRLIDRHRQKWEILEQQDKLLDAEIARMVIAAALEAVTEDDDG